MTRPRSCGALIVLAALAVGCGRPPETPLALRSLDSAAGSPAYRRMEAAAATEMAAVRSDRARAHAASRSGDLTTSETYAERGLARLQVVKLLIERSLADARLRDAEPRLLRSQQDLKELGQEQSMRDTRIRELELRLKIAGDLDPRTPRSPADSAARQKARLEVARSLGAEATLLCGAARLLGNAKATASIDRAAATIPKTPDFEKAVAARLSCLSALEGARRALGTTGKTDALLQQVSEADRFVVRRDDRGVVVTLAAVPSTDDLERLGRVARGHALQIVVHDAAPGASTAAAKSRGEMVSNALVAAGADKANVALELAGAALPVGDPAVPSLRAANERVEVVYVQ